LYLSVKRVCRNADGSIDWQFVFSRLGRPNFRYRRYQHYGGDKNKIIARLQELLEKNDPPFFNPAWVERHSYSLLKQVSTTFKSDWLEVIDLLGPKWRARFSHQHFQRQIEFYKGKVEFKRLVKKHQASLYTLYAVSNRQEEEIRNHVSLDFLEAAQAGNRLAFEFLLDSLMLTAQISEQLRGWSGFDWLMREKIIDCIMIFDLRKGNNLFSYLFATLKRVQLYLRTYKAYSLNDHFPDSTREMSEMATNRQTLQSADEFIDSIKLVLNKN
jgi:hypothetical protein